GREVYLGFDETQSCVVEQQARASYPFLRLLEAFEESGGLRSKLSMKGDCRTELSSSSGGMLSSEVRKFIQDQERQSRSLQASIEHYGLRSVLEGLRWLGENELLEGQAWS